MKKFITFIVLVILIGGIIYITKNSKSDELEVVYTTDETNVPVSDIAPPTDTADSTLAGTPSQTHTVTYTSEGFSPESVTIQPGDTVTFVNSTSSNMWVASDPHPQHTGYSDFDAGKTYAPNTNYSYTFTDIGTYTYHNHVQASMRGTVIVE